MLSELRQRYASALLDFAWRQWAQAGISSNTAGLDRWAIDPEALILFTVSIARRDPRLFDEVLDWLALNRQLLTIQRLRNLYRRFPADGSLAEAVIAWAGGPAASPPERPTEKKPVFSPDVLSFVGEPDPVFAEYGYLRPRATRSGKSRDPDLAIPANFAFRLRRLFGPGSRSEIMRVLLTVPGTGLDAARVADEAGFAKRNISDALAGLAEAGVVSATWSGNERVFLARRREWAMLLQAGLSEDSLPTFMSWVHLLPAALEIMEWLDHMADSTGSPYLISSRARDLMERVGPQLDRAGIQIPPDQPRDGADYLRTFTGAASSLLTAMSVA